MGQHDIGKAIKGKVQGYASEVDTDEVWAKLGLEKKKEKKFIPWLWGLAFLVFLVSATIIYDQQHQTSTAISTDTQIQSPTYQAEQKEKNTELIVSTPELAITEAEYTEILNAATDKEKVQEAEMQYSSKSLIPTTPKVDLDKETSISKSEIVASSYKKGEESLITQSKSIKKSQKGQIFLSALSQSASQKPTLISLNSIQLPTPKMILHAVKEEDLQVKLEKKYKNLSLIMTGGIFGVNKELKQTTLETNDHLTLRNESETSLEMLSVGAALQHKRKNGLFYELGIEYQSINERFDYSNELIDTVPQNNQPISYLIDTNRDTTLLKSGSGFSKRSMTETRKHFNNHQLYTVPITIGYEISRNRWSLHAKGTLLLSLRKFKGMQFNSINNITESPAYHPQQLLGGIRISAGVRYQMNEQLSLNFSPALQSYFSSFASESYGYDQKYQMHGIQLGVQYVLK